MDGCEGDAQRLGRRRRRPGFTAFSEEARRRRECQGSASGSGAPSARPSAGYYASVGCTRQSFPYTGWARRQTLREIEAGHVFAPSCGAGEGTAALRIESGGDVLAEDEGGRQPRRDGAREDDAPPLVAARCATPCAEDAAGSGGAQLPGARDAAEPEALAERGARAPIPVPGGGGATALADAVQRGRSAPTWQVPLQVAARAEEGPVKPGLIPQQRPGRSRARGASEERVGVSGARQSFQVPMALESGDEGAESESDASGASPPAARAPRPASGRGSSRERGRLRGERSQARISGAAAWGDLRLSMRPIGRSQSAHF